jgi:beta-phosphoglucomutase-like phosphatase (HAD superfamily)
MGARRGYHVIAARALLFDMDGLMVDSEPLWFRVQGDFVRSRGGRWTRHEADQCTGRGLANALRIMGEQSGVAIDPARDLAPILDAFAERVGELELKTGCRDLLAFAAERSVPRAVASSSAHRLIEAVLARFGLRECFDAVVPGEAVARAKPAPDIFLAAAARLGVAPADCVVLEDSLAGVEAARAAGMRVVAVPEKHDDRFAALADAVVADLHDVRSLLAL